MFYRLKRSIRYFRFHHQIARLLDTPPVIIQDAPLTIVSMVAGYDTKLYILAIKALYRRLGRGRIVAILDGVSQASQQLIRRHIPEIELIPLPSIDTGSFQRGGTWERLLFCIDRSASSYVIQMDADVLCVGPIPEVLAAVEANCAFTLADGVPKKPLNGWVEDAARRQSDNVVFEFERRGPEFPNSDKLLYLRGSSGFTGFARNTIERKFLEDFNRTAGAIMGHRWSEWGTEQIASNFSVANSPGSIGLPKPKYLTWEHHSLPEEVSLLHFLGYCRFDQGIFARFANREIDAILQAR